MARPLGPTKLTKELQDTLVKSLRIGLYVETACDLVGISKECFYNWMKEGESYKSGKHRCFSDAVKKAQAEAETRWIAHVVQDESWTSKAWLLERKHRNRWGKDRPQEIDGNIAKEAAAFILDMDKVEEEGNTDDGE